jgi:ribosomal protein L11 methyltransferase
VLEGDAQLLPGRHYDTVIANINRNILLNDIKTYATTLNANGTLFLSGFYTDDIPIIEAECNKYGLNHVETLERNNWVALKFEK